MRSSSFLSVMLARLLDQGILAPLTLQDDEGFRLYVHCDLCSMVEGCHEVALDPRTLTAEQDHHWRTRLGDSYGKMERFDPYTLRFWLLDRGERAGTLSVGTHLVGERTVPLLGLYVLAEHRHRGLAAAALRACHQAACAGGAGGIRLDAYWTWQRELRYYLRLGMWVVRWKHSIGFAFHQALPGYELQVGEEEATLALRLEQGREPLLHARRRGERLELERLPLPPLPEHCQGMERLLPIFATATLSLALALAGWPLIRSPEHWERRYASSDLGEPEGLAYKIGIFEHQARLDGWLIRTERLPGVPYDLDDESC